MGGEKVRFRSCGLQSASSGKSLCQKCSHIAQNLKQHCIRQLSSKSILLARMIRRKKPRQIPWQFITRAMPKRKRSQRRNQPTVLKQSQISPHRDAPQHQHRAWPQNFQIALQKVPAIRQLRRQRLIRRRRAAHGRGHVGILQRESVSAFYRSRLIGKSRAKQCLVEKITRAIARKHSPRAIAAMRRGCKSQNQKLRPRIAKSRKRLAPVIPSEKRSALVLRDLFAIPYQPRASAASNDFLV